MVSPPPARHYPGPKSRVEGHAGRQSPQSVAATLAGEVLTLISSPASASPMLA